MRVSKERLEFFFFFETGNESERDCPSMKPASFALKEKEKEKETGNERAE